MNKKVWAAAIAISAFACTSVAVLGDDTAGEATPLHIKAKAAWHDVDSGFELAKKENKPVLTDFYTSWCGWCKKMDRDTFDDRSVTKVMEQSFILVRADAEDHGAGQELARHNNITGYPTQIIFSPAGQPQATLIGYRKPAQFIAKLNDFLAGRHVTDDE